MPNTLLSILQQLHAYCVGSQVPCISQATQDYLTAFLQTHKPMRCLEIGSACGYSLFTTALTIQQRGGTIHGCERAYPNWVILNNTMSLMKQYGLRNCDCLFGPFLRTEPSIWCNKPYDFVFIDAQKAEYPLYVTYLMQYNLISHTSILVFDDVIKYRDRMTELTQTLKQHGFKQELKQLENDDGILIAYR